MSKQAKIRYANGKYKDEVVSNVASMYAGYLLLGCLCQYDKHVVHDGFSNQYSFDINDKSIIFVPSSLKQVNENQMRLKQRSEETRKEGLRRKGEEERAKEKDLMSEEEKRVRGTRKE